MDNSFVDVLVVGGFVAFLLFISTNYQKIKVKKMLEDEEKSKEK
ncbi:hypothetical protein ThvES_00020900 [Thiovulum sp. ES]|nr:hypothetical protein ThvES_00020900 [Thiovulum sp. ES]